MARLFRSQSQPHKDLIARLEASPAGEIDEALRDLERALKRASRPREKRGQPLDAAAVRLLAGSTDADGLLGRVPLEALARLAERTAARLDPADNGADDGARGATWDLLNLLRRPTVLRRIEPAESAA